MHSARRSWTHFFYLFIYLFFLRLLLRVWSVKTQRPPIWAPGLITPLHGLQGSNYKFWRAPISRLIFRTPRPLVGAPRQWPPWPSVYFKPWWGGIWGQGSPFLSLVLTDFVKSWIKENCLVTLINVRSVFSRSSHIKDSAPKSFLHV